MKSGAELVTAALKNGTLRLGGKLLTVSTPKERLNRMLEYESGYIPYFIARKFWGKDPMSLDLMLKDEFGEEVYAINITHNLGKMFQEAKVYDILWHGDGLIAGEQVEKLEVVRDQMLEDPKRFEQFNDPGGWGMYPNAMRFLHDVIVAFKTYPHCTITCSI